MDNLKNMRKPSPLLSAAWRFGVGIRQYPKTASTILGGGQTIAKSRIILNIGHGNMPGI